MRARNNPQAYNALMQGASDLMSRRTIYIVLFELLFLFLLVASTALYGKVLMGIAERVSTQGLDKLEDVLQNPDAPPQEGFNPAVFRDFMISVVAVSVALVLVIILCLSVSRSLIWTKLLDRNFTAVFFWRFLKLHLLWVPVFGIVLTAALLTLNKFAPFILYPNTFVIVLLVLLFIIAYFAQFLYYAFSTEKRPFFTLFFSALQHAIRSVPEFLVPYLIIILVFVAAGLVNVLILKFAPPSAARVLQLALLFVFATWYRYSMLHLLTRRT